MRFNLVACLILLTGVAQATPVQESFIANRADILSRATTVVGDYVFSVGRATSPRNRGDAVGYTKAEEQAKWNLGDKYRDTAAWPSDILETEKTEAWIEYRSQRPERFSVMGMQRIQTKKTPPDNYMVVMSFPSDQINVPRPTPEALKSALDAVRERKRVAEERARKVAEEATRKARLAEGAEQNALKDEVSAPIAPKEVKPQADKIKEYDNLDEDLML